MKRFLLLALIPLSVSAGEFPLRWVRIGYPAQSEVRDGVCVLYMQEDKTLAFRGWAEAAIRSCLQRGGMSASPAPGAVMVSWTEVTSARELDALMGNVGSALTPSSLLRPGHRVGIPEGQYERTTDGVCHVVTVAGKGALGHELKHCFDGKYHL